MKTSLYASFSLVVLATSCVAQEQNIAPVTSRIRLNLDSIPLTRGTPSKRENPRLDEETTPGTTKYAMRFTFRLKKNKPRSEMNIRLLTTGTHSIRLKPKQGPPIYSTKAPVGPISHKEWERLLNNSPPKPKCPPLKQLTFSEIMHWVAFLLAWGLGITMTIFVVGTLLRDFPRKVCGLICDTTKAVARGSLNLLIFATALSMIILYWKAFLYTCAVILAIKVLEILAIKSVEVWQYNKQLNAKRREAEAQLALHKQEQARKKRAILREKQKQLKEQTPPPDPDHEQVLRELEFERDAARLAAELQEQILREAQARKKTILVETEIAGLTANALIAKARGEDPRARLDLNDDEIDFNNSLGG